MPAPPRMGERQAHGAVRQALAQDVAIAVEPDEEDRAGAVARVALGGDDARQPALRGTRTAGDDAQRVPELAEHRVGDPRSRAGRERRGGEQDRQDGDDRDVVDRGLAALASHATRLPGIV